MNKTELVKAVAAASGVTNISAAKVVNATFETIVTYLQSGQNVSIPGFGTFMIKERKARIGHNPRTKEKLRIPAKKIVKFNPGKSLETLTGTSTQ